MSCLVFSPSLCPLLSQLQARPRQEHAREPGQALSAGGVCTTEARGQSPARRQNAKQLERHRKVERDKGKLLEGPNHSRGTRIATRKAPRPPALVTAPPQPSSPHPKPFSVATRHHRVNCHSTYPCEFCLLLSERHLQLSALLSPPSAAMRKRRLEARC